MVDPGRMQHAASRWYGGLGLRRPLVWAMLLAPCRATSSSFSSSSSAGGGDDEDPGDQASDTGVRTTLRGGAVTDDGTGDAYGPVTANLKNFFTGVIADGPKPPPVHDRGTPRVGRAPPGATPKGTPSLRIVGPAQLRALLESVQRDAQPVGASRRAALTFLEGHQGARAMATAIAVARGEDVDPLGPLPALASHEREAFQEAFAGAVEMACDYVRYPEREDIPLDKLLEERGLGDYEVPGKPMLRFAERPKWHPLTLKEQNPE